MKLERFDCDLVERGRAHVLAESLFRDEQGRNYTWCLREDHGLVHLQEDMDLSRLRGQKVSFSLDALASKKSEIRATKQRKRRYLVSEAERREWVANQLFSRAGLALTKLSIGPVIAPVVHSKGKIFSKPGARYSGTALVIDPSRLATAINEGIGDGKAYGFGMLIIKEL